MAGIPLPEWERGGNQLPPATTSWFILQPLRSALREGGRTVKSSKQSPAPANKADSKVDLYEKLIATIPDIER